MLKGIFLILLVFSVSSSASAGCRSSLFSIISHNTTNQSYSALGTGEETSRNVVETKALIRGEEIFHKAGQLMLKAQKNIYMQTWRFDHRSFPARAFAAYLEELSKRMGQQKRKNPVDVWMLINVTDLQNLVQEKKEIDYFVKHLNISPKYIRIHVGIYDAKTLAASHTKSISVDHKSAVVMGANMSDNYNGRGFFDLGFVVHGEVVHSIDKDFVQIWHSYVKDADMPSLKLPRVSGTAASSCMPVLFTRNTAYPGFTRKPQKSSINRAMLVSAISAEKTIDILTPNLNSKTFIHQIKEAIKEGVKVRVILSKYFEATKQNFPTRGGDNVANVTKLYRSLGTFASRPYLCSRLQIKWYSEDGVNALEKAKAPNSHAKFMVVDGRVTYFGSANMDNQSWNNSRELGLFVGSQAKSSAWLKQIYNPVFNRAIDVQECGGPEEPKPHNNNDR
jgi:phosphatidylserine/phosphatidylglycerophosphate/cardiolipin synthase-like enzyme